MGCNCIFEYPNIHNDLTIEITTNKSYNKFKKKLNKNKGEIIIRSLINDYKALNKNSTKIKLEEKYISNNIKKIEVPKKPKNEQRITNNNNKKIFKSISKEKINNNNTNENNDTNKIRNKKMKIIKVKKTHPERISYLKDVTKDSFSYFYLDNTFIVFTSFQNIFTLVYATKEKSLVSFDLINYKKINEIKGAHEELITNIRHIKDNSNKRDLVLSISYDSNIKIWDYNNLECLTEIKNIYESGYLFSACFLYNNNKFYIITSNYSENNDSLKIYDLKGNYINQINDSYGSTNFIDTFYDTRTSKNYIITGNIGCVKSFDFNKNKLYHIYSEEDYNDHCSVAINCNIYNKIIRLIESSGDGTIKIWNFHSGILMKRINIIYNKRVLGLCLWSDNYIFVGCEDKTMKLVDIKNEEVVNNLIGNNDIVLNIKKIKHPKYGDCLITQGLKNSQIKLWIKKIKKKKRRVKKIYQ